MASQSALLDLARTVLVGNYRPAPIVLARGRGVRVWDVDGKEYLDLSGGVAVNSVGHAHPTLAAAIAEQAERLIHVSNLFYNERGIELARALTERTGYQRAFFCNSGTEANEAALKLVRRYHFEKGAPERVEIVSTWRSFHGRTMGALTATGQAKYHEGMQPLIGGVVHVEFEDLEAMRAAIGPRTAAVILEPVQAEGGLFIGSDDYLRGVRELCDQVGALLIFDEVQTGYGRTGRFLAREWSGVEPDVVTLAKGIAGGFPLGAMLVKEQVAGALPPGSHGSTFGGNPLACAAALAVLRIFDEEGVVANSARVGAHLRSRLEELVDRLPTVTEARGIGLLQGVVLADTVDPGALVAALAEKGLLVTLAGGNVVRLCPSLTITVAEVDEGLATLESVLRDPPRKTP